MGRLADAAFNTQYHQTMVRMLTVDKERDAVFKVGSRKPDEHPTNQVTMLTSERASLTYQGSRCATVGLEYRGAAEKVEADGKCVDEMDRTRTIELKALSNAMGH